MGGEIRVLIYPSERNEFSLILSLLMESRGSFYELDQHLSWYNN
jgi:hypothetical protein